LLIAYACVGIVLSVILMHGMDIKSEAHLFKQQMAASLESKMSNIMKNVRERAETLHENSCIEGIAISMSSSCFSVWTRMSFMGLNVIFLDHSTTGVVFFKIVYTVSIFPIVFKRLFIIISTTDCLSWLCGEHRITGSKLVGI
jgi:hypothetical protein